MNATLSIGSITSILMPNSLSLTIGCYGKVGYHPSYLVLALLSYNTSYLSILFDLTNKWAYFSSFTVTPNVSIPLRCPEYRLVSLFQWLVKTRGIVNIELLYLD